MADDSCPGARGDVDTAIMEEEMTLLQFAGGCCVAALGVGVWLKLLSMAVYLMNEPSDVAVLIGTCLLFAILGSAGFAVGRLLRWGAARDCRVRAKGLATSMRLLVLSLVPFLAGCAGCTVVNPGYVGIKVNMLGSNRGVQDIPMVTGWVFYNPFTQRIYEYPTFVQTAAWTRSPHEGSPSNEEVTFNDKSGLVITADISLSYQLQPDKVPHFYVKFRSDDLAQFTHGFLRNIARDAFNEVGGTYAVEEIYGAKKEEVVLKVRERINGQVSDIGVVLQQFGFIGAPRPPQNVIESINMKIAATQNAMRVENEVRQTQAEAQKAVAKAEGEAKAAIARAEGEAKANRVLAESITPELLQWRNLQITEQAVARWDGKRPMVEGQGSGMLLQIPLPK
jgi:regulator of protease activity HflC (stomatin/prohibitin superfamily)